MKRTALLALFLNVLLLPLASGQQVRSPHSSLRHPHHRQMFGNAKAPLSSTMTAQSFYTDPTADIAKTWDFGTYNGGAWVELSDVNDFGFAVGTGDIGTNETRTLLVPLFGPNAGKWLDLGSLGGQIFDWDEPLVKISNTGLVATHSALPDGHRHAAAWTQRTGLFDLHTLAELDPSRYPEYNSSMAAAVNRSGTLIVGWSAIEDACLDCAPSLPVAWTPSFEWKNGQLAVAWKMQKLDTQGIINPITGQEDLVFWYAWDVNDMGQILGIAHDMNFTGSVGILWNPLPHGKGWKATALPSNSDYSWSLPFNINNRGVIGGALQSADETLLPAVVWKPLDAWGISHSSPVFLPTPDGLNFGWVNGSNEFGEISGTLWGDAGEQAIRWTMKDLNFVQILTLPGDSGEAGRINNLNIVIGNFSGGDCGGWLCGAAVQIHSPTKDKH